MTRTERTPTREELVCLVCRKPGVALHHIRPRSTAPQSRDDPWNIVPICPVCHDLVHQKRMEMRIRRGYFEWRQKGAKFWVSIPVKVSERHGCIDFGAGGRAEAQGVVDDGSLAPSEAGSAAAEAEDASLSISAAEEASSSTVERLADNQEYVGSNPTWPHNSAAAPPASGGKVDEAGKQAGPELAPTRTPSRAVPACNRGSSSAKSSTAEAGEEVAVSVTEVSRASTSAVPFLSLEFWCQRGMKLVSFGLSLKGIADEWRWAVGDWFNEGETVLGEEAYAYTEPFRGETVQQYAWVARSVGRNTRVETLPWTYHRSVAALPPGEQTEWLQEAREKNMTSRELHQAIHGKQPRVKRWSFEELESHLCHTCREVVSLMEKR